MPEYIGNTTRTNDIFCRVMDTFEAIVSCAVAFVIHFFLVQTIKPT